LAAAYGTYSQGHGAQQTNSGLTPGDTYVLDVDQGTIGGANGTRTWDITVFDDNGNEILAINTPNASVGSNRFQEYCFTATSTSVTVRFRSSGTNTTGSAAIYMRDLSLQKFTAVNAGPFNPGNIEVQTNELDTATYQNRLDREWKVDETGELGNLTLSAAINGRFTSAQPVFLLIDNDDDFAADVTAAIPATSWDGTTATFEGVNLNDGDYFTFAAGEEPPAPGGVSGNLALWLKADADFTPALWEDQSINENDANQSIAGQQATLIAEDDNQAINFNPVAEFNSATNTEYDVASDLSIDLLNEQSAYYVFRTDLGGTDHNFLSQDGGGSSLTHRIRTNGGFNTFYLDQSGGSYGILASTTLSAGDIAIGSLQRVDNTTFQIGLDGLIENTQVNGANISFTNSTNTFIGGNGTSGTFSGEIAEAVIYNDNHITGTTKQQIESYLALKYGITLDQSTAQDYLASDGTTLIWDASENTGFGNDIFGIGRDDASALGQVLGSIPLRIWPIWNS